MKSTPPRTTIDDVARAAGVSTATVSRVVNASGQVSPRTAAKVQKAIESLSYIPDGAARNLARGKKQVIGITLPGMMTTYYASLLHGLDIISGRNSYSLLIHVNHFQANTQPDELVLGDHNTDGLLVFTDSVSDNVLVRLHNRGFPVVMMYRSPPAGTNFPSIKLDNRPAVMKLMDHLIVACGYRRIAHLRGPAGNEDADEREAAYRESLQKHGIPFDPALVGYGNFVAAHSEQVVANWLEEGLQFDAIFGGDDNTSVGAMAALRRAGLRIPEDIGVVGFNDDSISRHQSPPLTTVRSDTAMVGREAGKLLFQLINGEQTQSLTMVPSELIIRDSCGYNLRK